MQIYCNCVILYFFTKSIPLTAIGRLIGPAHSSDVAREINSAVKWITIGSQ